MLGESLAIRVIGILFLEPRGIRQEYFQKIGGCRCGVNRTLEAIANETRQIAGSGQCERE